MSEGNTVTVSALQRDFLRQQIEKSIKAVLRIVSTCSRPDTGIATTAIDLMLEHFKRENIIKDFAIHRSTIIAPNDAAPEVPDLDLVAVRPDASLITWTWRIGVRNRGIWLEFSEMGFAVVDDPRLFRCFGPVSEKEEGL